MPRTEGRGGGGAVVKPPRLGRARQSLSVVADLSVSRYETQQERRDDRGKDVRQDCEDARQGEEDGDVDDHAPIRTILVKSIW